MAVVHPRSPHRPRRRPLPLAELRGSRRVGDAPFDAVFRRLLLTRADRVVGLATKDKLGTVAPFEVGPADALTHLVTDADAPDALVAPYRDLGVDVVR